MRKLSAAVASLTILFAFVACDQSTDTPKETPWTSVTSIDGFVGTWVSLETSDGTMGSSGDTYTVTTTNTVENGGTWPISFSMVQDYTEMVVAMTNMMAQLNPAVTEASVWSEIQQEMDDTMMGVSVTFSTASPWMASVAVSMTEDQAFAPGTVIEKSPDGTQLRITSTDSEGTSVMTYTKQ